MDPRYPALPFAHPQPQQTPQETRYGPIPPSPFASQPSQRTDTLHKNDPVLRRRIDLEEPRQSASLTNAPQSYILPHALRYPSTSIATTQDPTMGDPQLRRGSFSTAGLWGDARGDRLALHAATGMEMISYTSRVLLSSTDLRSVLSLRFAAVAAVVLFFALRSWHGEPRIAASQADLSSDACLKHHIFKMFFLKSLRHIRGCNAITCAHRDYKRLMMCTFAPPLRLCNIVPVLSTRI